jgi:hypothetical protein
MLSNAPSMSASTTQRRLPCEQASVWICRMASWAPRPGRKPKLVASNRASHSGSSAFFTRACMIWSKTVGMPSGRSLPLALGMYTRRAGWAFQGWVCRWSLSAIIALDCGVVMTTRSTPAVLRPALSCVTLRTLTSVLE